MGILGAATAAETTRGCGGADVVAFRAQGYRPPVVRSRWHRASRTIGFVVAALMLLAAGSMLVSPPAQASTFCVYAGQDGLACDIHISGTVRDEQGDPVEGATVELWLGPADQVPTTLVVSTVTGADGTYEGYVTASGMDPTAFEWSFVHVVPAPSSGVAEQWFTDISEFEGFISEPEYLELIAPDEQRFLDMSKVEFIITEEPHVVIDRIGGAAAPGVSP